MILSKKFSGVLQTAHFIKALPILICFVLTVFLFDLSPPSAHARFTQLDMVPDVKSRFSDGCSSIQELASLAQHRGIDVMIFSDHHRDSLEYGIFPLEKIIKKKNEKPSVMASGINTYLAEIFLNNKTFTNIRLIPSVESSPFYYWTGGPFQKQLVAHNWNKHLGIIGLDNPKDYEGLPDLNGRYSKRYVGQAKIRFLFFGLLFFVSVALVVLYRDRFPKSVYLSLATATLLLLNNHPFVSSPYNQYGGDQGIDPYQEVIDYVADRGGMTFWNHLENSYPRKTRTGESMLTETHPHPADLLIAKNYTGFQAVDDKPVAAADPGKEWDQTLLQYLRGERSKPVWGYGANDFHCEEQDGHKLGSVRTIVLVSENSDNDVFNALRTGRMYAVRKTMEDERLSLDEFSITDRTTGKSATLGQELESGDFPEIKINISAAQEHYEPVRVTLIRNGKIVKEDTASLPYQLVWRDLDVERKGKVYYRLKAESGPTDLILSNPVFVKFSDQQVEVASFLDDILSPARKERKKFKMADPTVAPESMYEDQVLKTFDTKPSPAKIPAAPERNLTKVRKPSPRIVREPRVIAPPRQTELLPRASRIDDPPSMKPREKSRKSKFVKSLVNNLALKKGPGEIFPNTGKAAKGERLLFVRRTSITSNDKAWIVVKKNNQMYYVWEGFVQFE